MSVEIPISTPGVSVIVDEADVEEILRYSWSLDGAGYPCRYVERDLPRLKMHNHLMGEPPAPGLTVDHKNRNRLDHRRSNLRWATDTEQRLNKGYPDRGLPRGCYKLPSGRYQSSIRIEGKGTYLGSFDTPEEAHAAWREAAIKQWGLVPGEAIE